MIVGWLADMIIDAVEIGFDGNLPAGLPQGAVFFSGGYDPVCVVVVPTTELLVAEDDLAPVAAPPAWLVDPGMDGYGYADSAGGWFAGCFAYNYAC